MNDLRPSLGSIAHRAALALLAAAALAARGQTTDQDPAPTDPPPPLAQCHVWQVSYDDRELGIVDGTAVVDWAGLDAQIRLISPVDGTESVLNAIKVTAPGPAGQAEFVMTGSSPNMGPVLTPSIAGMPNAGGQAGADATARRGGPAIRAKLAQRDFADDTVTISLGYGPDGLLSGNWHYQADPLTQRSRDGTGRVGAFTMPGDDPASFLGMQTGPEHWTYLPPAIYFAVVLEDQSAQSTLGPTYRYPTPVVAPERGAGAPSNTFRTHRQVMIVGKNLPIIATSSGHSRSLEPIKTDRADLQYGRPALLAPPKPGADPDDDVERAWRTITNGMDEATAKSVRTLQAATVSVDFAPGVLPGTTEFSWGSAKASWPLQFGDNTASVRVVRPLTQAEWEPTPVAFLPEQLYVEVETALSLPVDSIKVYIAANGALMNEPLVATRLSASSRVYRTGPVVLKGDAPGPTPDGQVIPAKLGDHVTFIADQKGALFFGAAQATVAVYNDPSELATTWDHELSICAKLYGKSMPEDWAHLPNQQAVALTSYFIFATSEHSITTNITLGQHAAMLMLRDLFVELMKRQLANLQTTATYDDGVLGFGKVVAQSIRRNPNSLFAPMPAGSLSGSPVTLAGAVNDPAVEGAFGNDVDALRAWRVAAFRTGLLAYTAAIQKSIDQAAGIATNDPKGLLKLTGVSFDAITSQLLPRMMRFDKDSGRWVPDRVARGNVTSIAGAEQQLEQQKAAATIDTQLAVGVATAAASAPMMLSESAFASFLTWAANGLLWEVPAMADAWDLHIVKNDVEFAVGSSAVLGQARYDEVKTLDTDWWKFAAVTLAQGVATHLTAIDTLSKLNRELSVARGVIVLEGMDGGVVSLRNLSKAQLGDVEAAAIEAHALADAKKTLSPVQQRALDTWNSYLQEAKAGEAAISQEWLRINHMKQGFVPTVIDKLIPQVPGGSADTTAQVYALAALKRRDELVEAARELRAEAQKLTAAKPSVVEDAWQAVADQIADSRSRAGTLESLLADSRKDISKVAKMSDSDVAWITGVQREVDQAKMTAILKSGDSAWNNVKDAYKAGTVSACDMHQFITWRQQVVNPMLDEVLAEVKQEMSGILGRPVELNRKALGSTNLTSDYDISVEGPGAERVVAKFNERFRAQFGYESAFVFDTNIYTDPAYKLFKARALESGSLALGTVEMDTVRQFVYDQMATCKYAPDEVWKAHKALLTGKAAPETKAMLDYAFKQAEAGNAGAQAILKKFKDVATGKDAEFQAFNLAYADVLGTIDTWRLEMYRLDDLFVEGAAKIKAPTDTFLQKYPLYKEKLDKLQALIRDGNTKDANLLRNAMEGEVIAQIRDSQGTALYFASEAYQSEGTIIHVVDELQGGGGAKRSASLQALLGKPVKTPLDTLSYINSFNENRANLFKELGHLGYYPGHAKMAASKTLAAKSSKYFIRQLDAMKQAGMDIKTLVGTDLISMTSSIDAVRGNENSVQAILDAAGYQNNAYVDKIIAASDALAVAGVNDRQFADLAKYLQPDFADLNRIEGAAVIK